MKNPNNKMTRREFIKITGAGMAGATALASPLGSLVSKASAATPPDLPIEKEPFINILRWSAFVEGDKELWEKNCRKWEKITGGKIINEWFTWTDVRPKAAMSAAVGAGPDIVLGWHDDPFLYPDKLLDVSDVAQYLGAKYGGWEDVALKYGINPSTGRWIDIPMGAAGQAITYRESWMKEAGWDEFPTTVEEFIKLGKKLKSMGHPTGHAMGHAVGDGNNWCHSWLWSFGAKTVNPDGSTAINSPETRTALETMKELYDDAMIAGVASWLDPYNNKAYLAEQIGLTNNSISIYDAALKNKEKPHIAKDTNHSPYPIGPIGRPAELNLFDVAFIYKHAKNPNACKHFLMFMLENEQCAPWTAAMRGYVTPCLKAYRNLPVWTEDPKHFAYRDCVRYMLWNGYEGPIGPASAAVMAEYVVVDLFANYCARGMSADRTIERAEKAIAKAYRK